MKKLLISLLVITSCTICKKQKDCKLKKSHVENITYTYDSTVWKVLPMTKADSIWIDSVSNLNN